jgi:hypothetical protein
LNNFWTNGWVELKFAEFTQEGVIHPEMTLTFLSWQIFDNFWKIVAKKNTKSKIILQVMVGFSKTQSHMKEHSMKSNLVQFEINPNASSRIMRA